MEAMTTAEIIHVYENSTLRSKYFTREADTAAYVAGLAALHEKAERENPAPLTPEQIKQMRGKPVYCPEMNSYGVITFDTTGPWANVPFLLFYWLEREDDPCGVQCQYNIEGRGLTIYPYKPKEKGGGTT